MNSAVGLLVFFAISVAIGIAAIRFVRHLRSKHDHCKRPIFAPTTTKDHPYGYGSVVLACLSTGLVMVMRAFDLEYAWIRPIAEITPYNGSIAELLVTVFVIVALVVARYFSVLRILFFSVALLLLVLSFLFGRDIANVYCDTSASVHFLGTVTHKKIVAGGRKSQAPDDYYLQALPRNDNRPIEIPVSEQTYHAAAAGDEISLEVHGGYFDRKWADSTTAVLHKARQ